MIVPVLYWNANPDASATDYWDHAFIRYLFDQEQWHIPGVTYQETREVPETGGAVVVVPARHNAGVKYRYELKALLASLDWAVVILTGDEERRFPVPTIMGPRRKLWVMSARAPRTEGIDQPLGTGWPPGIRDVLRTVAPENARTIDATFMGQDTHERRHDCVRLLTHFGRRHRVHVQATEGFTQGVAQDDYWRTLANAKLAPCPSGPVCSDSFRFYEALEAGCLPLADNRVPGDEQVDYWRHHYGPEPPFPIIDGAWDENVEHKMASLLKGWPANATRCFSWWQQEKRALALRLADHVREVSGEVPRGTSDTGEKVSVIIPTSPAPIHPSTAHIEETIESVRAQLPDAEIVVVADGVRPEQADTAAEYQGYLRRLAWMTNLRWPNTVLVTMDEWGHQANATRRALELIRRPFVLFVEHDTPLLDRYIDWPGLQRLVESGELQMVRFLHEEAVLPDHRHLMLDDRPDVYHGVPIWRTVQWSQRPHLAHVDFYREQVMPYFGVESRTMIEDVMHGVIANGYAERGERAWWQWRIGIYCEVDELGIKRSTHLDSRGNAPKFSMKIAYDGEPPRWAPNPRILR